jgi:hypothetical protein
MIRRAVPLSIGEFRQSSVALGIVIGAVINRDDNA